MMCVCARQAGQMHVVVDQRRLPASTNQITHAHDAVVVEGRAGVEEHAEEQLHKLGAVLRHDPPVAVLTCRRVVWLMWVMGHRGVDWGVGWMDGWVGWLVGG